MVTDSYERLRLRLDAFPTSFPATEDGVEIAILKKLFSEEEADMAAQLPLMDKEETETVQVISSRTGKSVDEGANTGQQEHGRNGELDDVLNIGYGSFDRHELLRCLGAIPRCGSS